MDAPVFQVGEGAQHDYGVYATDLDPFATSRTEIVEACFAHMSPPPSTDGVLVLDAERASFPFRNPAPHIWLHDAPPFAAIDLDDVVVGVGVRTRAGWALTEIGR